MHIKKQTCLECYNRTKRCLMKLLMFTHIKRYTLTLIQMPSLCISCLTQYLESIWRLSKKEDNRVRRINDSRQLNKGIKSKQYLLPIITDILRKHSGYIFFAKLDVSMQYYMFELDNKSQDSCTIITPFGKYILETPDGTQMLSRQCSSNDGNCQIINEEFIW